MIIFEDVITGDEMFSDSYPYEEIEDGFFIQAEGTWKVVGDVDVDIGANPSAEGGDDEAVDPTQRRVVDLIDGFQLQETAELDKKSFMAWVKPWLGKVMENLPADQHDEFKAKSTPAIKWLLSKLKDLQFFTGASMDPDATLVFAYYKDGASNPTMIYPKYALKQIKC